MRTFETPATNKEKLMAVFRRKQLIWELCEDFGEPGGVAHHLKKIASNKFLMLLLEKEIKVFEKEADDWHALYLEREYEREKYQSGCYACGMGNGEGGCTIPGYCPYQY